MKISYIAHASLLLETPDSVVVTDPWYFGPAYKDQWHVFPKPVDTSFTSKVTHVILSQGHEDHFHPPTLKHINKKAQVYYPYIWKSGAVRTIKRLGFKEVFEVPHFNTVVLGENFTVTYVLSGMDAFTVYDYNGVIVLNLSDALNALHENFILMFSGLIRRKWPVIDYMICGVGGAGYFPNTIHSPLKDDQVVAGLREEFLAHKFCELVNVLRPRHVIPFVPGFALLENDKRWINEMKFPRTDLEACYAKHFNPRPATKFLNLLPGDYIENDQWVKASPYHNEVCDDNLGHLLHKQYASEIESCNRFETQPASVVTELSYKLSGILPVSTSGIGTELLQKINLAIAFKDVRLERYIHVYFNGRHLVAEPVEKTGKGIKIKITTHTWKLDFALTKDWGGDIFFFGYGADIDILDPSCIEDNLDICSLRLLSRFPTVSYNIKREPFRALKYLTQNIELTTLAIRQKISANSGSAKSYNGISRWVNKSKFDVCRLSNIPLLSVEFGESLRGYAR